MNLLIRAMVPVLLAIAAQAGAQQSATTRPQLGGELPDTGQAQVGWLDPAQFTEARVSPSTAPLEGSRVRQLAQYMQAGIQKRLAPGARMVVVITDLDRAGGQRGAAGVQVLDMKVPPTIKLQFARTDAEGQVAGKGERTLADASVMDRPTLVTDTDPLRYEKRLVDGWLDEELGKKK